MDHLIVIFQLFLNLMFFFLIEEEFITTVD